MSKNEPDNTPLRDHYGQPDCILAGQVQSVAPWSQIEMWLCGLLHENDENHRRHDDSYVFPVPAELEAWWQARRAEYRIWATRERRKKSLETMRLRSQAMAKLTEDERRALGFD